MPRAHRWVSVLSAALLCAGLQTVGTSGPASAATTATTTVATVLAGGVGDNGPAAEALLGAAAFDLDPVGNVLFYDQRSRQIRRIDALTGQVAAVWGSGATATRWPVGPVPASTVAVPAIDRLWTTTSGDLYVRAGRDVDSGNIYRIAADGTLAPAFRPSFSQFPPLVGVTYVPIFVRRDGSLLVSRIERDANNVYTGKLWGLPPNEPSSTTTTTLHEGIVHRVDEAVDGTLYVLAGDPAAIHRIDSTGSTVAVGPGPTPRTANPPDGTAAGDLTLPTLNFGVAPSGTVLFYVERVDTAVVALRVVEPGGTVRTVGVVSDTKAGDSTCSNPDLVGLADGALLACGGPVWYLAYDGDVTTRPSRRYGLNPSSAPVTSPEGTPAQRAFVASMGTPAVDPRDGTVVVPAAGSLYRLAGPEPLTTLQRIFGGGTPGTVGDGGPARDSDARGATPAFAPDGSYVVMASSTVADAQQYRIRDVSPEGTISTLVGGGTRTGNLDGVDAREANLLPGPVALSADGRTVYFAQDPPTGSTIVYRVSRDGGPIRRVAGGGSASPSTPVPALDANLFAADVLQVGPNGTLYLTAYQTLYRMGLDGVLAPEPTLPGSHVVAPDGSIYTAAGDVVWKRRPDGAFVVVLGEVSKAQGRVGDRTIAPSSLALLPDGRLLVRDYASTPTESLRVLTPVDRDWADPAPTLTVTPTQTGQFGKFTARVEVPPGPAPWTVKLRASRTAMPGYSGEGASLIDVTLPAEGGTRDIEVARLSHSCVNTSSCPQLPAGATVDLALFSLSGAGEQAPPPVRTAIALPDALPRTVLTPTIPTGLVVDRTVELKASLREATGGAPVAGATLTLQRRTVNDHDWHTIGAAVTGADGAAKVSEKPYRNARYRWTFAGSETHKFTDPVEFEGPVKPTISVSVRSLVRAGDTLSFTATLPVAAGVFLEERVNGIWKQVGGRAFASVGSGDSTVHTAKLTTKSSARREFRMVTEASEFYAQAVSSTVPVNVYQVAIGTIHGNAKGTDSANLNDEYLTIKNTGKVAIDLKGWVLKTKSTARSFTLSTLSLAPGASVTVRAGKGKNTKTTLYLNAGKPIWSNSKDTGSIYDPNKVKATTYSYD